MILICPAWVLRGRSMSGDTMGTLCRLVASVMEHQYVLRRGVTPNYSFILLHSIKFFYPNPLNTLTSFNLAERPANIYKIPSNNATLST
jgi:hypothetical protein